MTKTGNNVIDLHVAISGGARGIGEATARSLIRCGARVSLGDIDVDAAKITADAINASSLTDSALQQPRCIGLGLDVTSSESFEQFLTSAEDTLGPVDVTINNAGIMRVGRFLEETEQVTDAQVAINILGVINGTRSSLTRMERRGNGQIINIASVAGRNAFAHLAVYSGTKHFVHGYTESLRAEYRGSGIDFTTVFPNIAHTRLGAGVRGIKLVPKCTVDQIAGRIVDAVDRPQPYVHIPRAIGVLSAAAQVAAPRVRDRAFALLGADRAMINIDSDARSGYESEIVR